MEVAVSNNSTHSSFQGHHPEALFESFNSRTAAMMGPALCAVALNSQGNTVELVAA